MLGESNPVVNVHRNRLAVGTCLLAVTLVLVGAVSPVGADDPSSVGMPIQLVGGLNTHEQVHLPVVDWEHGTPSLLAFNSEEGLFDSRPDWRWKFLPKGVLYGTYWASSAEPRLAVKVVSEQALNALVDTEIGGRVPIVRFGAVERLEGWQFDVLGGVNLRQDPNDEMDVQATDYRFDLPLTYRKGPHAFKVGYYHVSSHLGDEYILKNNITTRDNFLRDVINFGYSYNPLPELRLYGEFGYGFHVDVSEPWEMQFGVDYGPATFTGIYGAPFVAVNVHLREELNFGGNVALQLGWAWRGEGIHAGILRTGAYYYDGGSPQFSFHRSHETQVGWGLWYDF